MHPGPVVLGGSATIIHQQYIVNSQDGEFESEILAFGVSRKLKDDNIEDKILANIEDEEAPSELLISKKSEELKSIDSGVQLLAEELRRQERHEERLDFERSSAEELAIKQRFVRVGNIKKPVQFGEHLFPTAMTHVNSHDGRFNSIILTFQRAEKSETIVRENLDKYIISTGKANIVILTRALAVIFTEYNRVFYLSLWDPVGRSYECSSDHHPMIRCTFQSAKR